MSAQIIQFRDWQQPRDLARMYGEGCCVGADNCIPPCPPMEVIRIMNDTRVLHQIEVIALTPEQRAARIRAVGEAS